MLYGVNKDLFLTRRHVIWCLGGLYRWKYVTAVGRELVKCTLDVLSVPVVRWCEVYIGCTECTGC